jgi:capsular polysaccharide biosynthesis protein
MDLAKRTLLMLRRRWLLVVVPVVVALAAVLVYDALIPKEYTATASLFLRAPDVKSSASAYQGNLFTMQRANTYVNMVESDELAQMVVDRLGLDTSAHDLATKVNAAPIRDTVIINVSVTDRDAQLAADIANTYGTVFATYVARVEAVAPTADIPPLVTIVKPAAAENAVASRPSMWLLLSLAAALGLLVGIGLIWLAERYDTKIRSRRQIEEITGARVLGNLSRQKALGDGGSVEKVFESSPDFADEVRVIGVNAEYALREVSKANGTAVLMVACVDHGDGQSVVANALAKALDERGARVALLDEPPDGAVTASAIGVAIENHSQENDFIIVDPNGSGVSPQIQAAAGASDAAVIVVRPSRTDENGLADLVNSLNMLDTPVIGIITNAARETNTSGRFYA